MIIHLKSEVTKEKAEQLGVELESIVLPRDGFYALITSSKGKPLDAQYEQFISAKFPFDDDMQLASRKYINGVREIKITDAVSIGGSNKNTIMITGPCSVESEEQIEQCSELCVELGVKVLRAGAYKPRTTPYAFQGMGLEGLKLLDKMRTKHGLKIITEIRDSTHAAEVIEYADILQIGAKAMYDHGILKACGKSGKPVLLKRGFGATLQEFVQAAEFILSAGNDKVILCERGIRTFETKTRFTLDLCGVAYLKQYTNLPIILDPSHAIGFAYGVADLSKACVAMGVDGLLIETHPNPAVAKSDAAQQLNFKQFRELYAELGAVATAVGRKMI